MLDAVGTISGQQGFRVWKTNLRDAINLFAPDLKPILAGADSPAEPEPDEGGRAKWDQANSRLFSLVFFITPGFAHVTVLTHKEVAAATSSSAFYQTPPAAPAATPAAPSSIFSESPAQDHRLPSGFCAFMTTPAEMSLAPFRSDGSCIRVVVDSGATNNCLDPVLTPRVRAHLCDVEDLQVPHRVVAAGQHLLKGVTTGTVFESVTDDNRNDRRVSFRVVLVPDLITNLFSVTAAMQKGVATLFLLVIAAVCTGRAAVDNLIG